MTEEKIKIDKLNAKCLELEERVTFLEATIYKFRITLEPNKVRAADIKEFCETVDDYFNSMEAIKNGNKIGSGDLIIIDMSNPLIFSTLSKFTSGKIICSLIPKV